MAKKYSFKISQLIKQLLNFSNYQYLLLRDLFQLESESNQEQTISSKQETSFKHATWLISTNMQRSTSEYTEILKACCSSRLWVLCSIASQHILFLACKWTAVCKLLFNPCHRQGQHKGPGRALGCSQAAVTALTEIRESLLKE